MAVFKTQTQISARRIGLIVLISAACAIAAACPKGKGYFAPTPSRATHVAPHSAR
jgi:hypothetical protein